MKFYPNLLENIEDIRQNPFSTTVLAFRKKPQFLLVTQVY